VADQRDGTRGEVLVGRARELARLVGFLDDAVAGDSRLVLCSGEAGIGKTRLAEEAVLVASERGVRVAWARSTDDEMSVPFGMWRIALPDAESDPPGRPGSSARPDLWPAFVVDAARPAMIAGLSSGVEERFELFNNVSQRLADAAAPCGLLLVLDDIQWADEASLVLLRHVARQSRGTRMLILATWRIPGSVNDARNERILELAADASTKRIELLRLGAEGVGELLGSTGLALPADQIGALHVETGGNPFLVREMALMLSERPRGGPGGFGAVPIAVRDATAHRLRRLSESGRALLRDAAVAGNRFSIGIVAQMLDTPVLSLLDAVDECVRAGFLVAGDRPGEHRFTHALVRSAVMAQISAADQVRLHNAAGDAIERLFQGQQWAHLAEFAHHRVSGSLPGDRARAVLACEAAGDAATADLAFEEAARQFRAALTVGDEEIATADRDRLELALVAALYRSGDLPGWHDVAIGLAERAERRSDRLLLARLAVVMDATGDVAWDSQVCRVCEQALSGRDLSDKLRTRVLARYAQTLVYRSDYERAGETSRQALDLAESVGDPAVVVEALRARQLACSAPDGSAERALLAVRMLEMAELLRNVTVEMWGRLWRIDRLFETGQLVAVASELLDLASCIERVHQPEARWHLLENSATLAHATGRYEDATRLAGDAYAVMSQMGHPLAIGAYAVVLGQVGMHIGFGPSGQAALMAQLPPHLAPGSVPTSGVASVFPALSVALIRAQEGDHDGAAQAYEQAGPVRSWNPTAALRLSAWAHGLRVAIELGRMDDVAYLATMFEPFRGRHVANGAGSGVYMGPVELALGQAESALALLDTAIEDLENAVVICQANGARGYVVEASIELCAALARRGEFDDRKRCAALLESAGGNAAQLGMHVLTKRASKIQSLLSSSGDRHPKLSPRELEVANLVGEGYTNKKIADILFISERTAQNHVQHILTKLGFSNRSQVAVWASELSHQPGPAVPKE